MDNKFNKTKYICMLSTVICVILMFFNYFTLSVPSLNELLISDSFSISFMTLPFFVSENVVGLRSEFGGNKLALLVLIMCALLKIVSLLLGVFALLGLWRVCIKKERFNMHMTKGSLIFEIGTYANSMDEAKNCAVKLSEIVSDVLLNK